MEFKRCLLHVDKLQDFSEYLVDHGWEILPNKSQWEVLRAKHGSIKMPLIVYKKSRSIKGEEITHYTTHGVAYHWARNFIYDERNKKMSP